MSFPHGLVGDSVEPSTEDSPKSVEDELTILRHQKQLRDSIQPSVFAKLFVNHTKKTCGVACLIPILAVVIIIITGSLAIDNPQGREYYVRNHILTRLADGRDAARDTYPFDQGNETQTNIEDIRQTDYEGSMVITILLRGKDPDSGKLASLKDFTSAENLLTPASIAIHKRAEDEIINHENYTSFCERDVDQLECDGTPAACVLPDSYLNHPKLYGKLNGTGTIICGRRPGSEEVSEDNFKQFLASMFGDDPLNLKNFFDVNMTSKNRKAWAVQTHILIGLPFAGYNSSNDQVTEQEKEYLKWADSAVGTIEENLTTSTTDVFPISSLLANNLFGSIVLRDLAFSVLAIVLVFIVIWLHTSSFFLALVAMVQIFLSFPITFVIYHFVFRQLYFAALQILSIFLLLGIGADDVFVFTDAWKQATIVLGPDVDLLTRMTWTYRRAVRAMTVTSLTTAAAFFVTAASPIMPIATLGIWAGILILLQFVLVITMYPCATVIWHRFWRPRMAVRLFKKVPEEDVEKENATPIWHRLLPVSKRPNIRNVGEYRAVERFFHGPWFRLVRRGRLIFITIAFVGAGIAIWRASLLEGPEEAENFLPENNPVRISLITLQDAFPRSDSDLQLRVRMVWGLKDVDRAGTSKFDVNSRGEAVFDDDFDLKKKEVQQHIFDTCKYIEDQGDLLFELDTGIKPVRCWIRDYAKWREEVVGQADFETFETDKELVADLLNFTEYRVNGKSPYSTYSRAQDLIFNTNRTKVIMTELLFVSDKESVLPEKLMWPVYQRWKEVLDTRNGVGPTGGNKGITSAGEPWLFSVTQRTLQRSMITGVAIMIVVALFTLIFATLNVIVAILATLSIAGVVSMLLGAIQLYAWPLGISESIGVVIGVGFSFDGIAHVATAYIESKSKNRFDRTQDALADLGISVLFGSITTILAGICLLPAIIIFFTKFARLILTTITLSLLWSLVFFPAMLMTFGPENKFASIGPLFSRLFAFARRKRRTPEMTKTGEELEAL